MFGAMKKIKSLFDYKLFVIAVIIGGVIDIYVNKTGKYSFLVTESFIDIIYSAIVTISIICFSIIAILSSFLPKTFYGYRLIDLLKIKDTPLNIKTYLNVSLLFVFASTVFLILNSNFNSGYLKYGMVNSLIVLLFSSILYQIHIVKIVYRIISEEEYCIEIIKKHYDNMSLSDSLTDIISNLDKLFKALDQCIMTGDKDTKDNLCQIFIRFVENKKIQNNNDVIREIQNRLYKSVTEYADVFGYNDMIVFVANIANTLKKDVLNELDLYLKPINEIKFFKTNKIIDENKYFTEIKSIQYLKEYDNNLITNENLYHIYVCYFDSINNNEFFSEKIKKSLVKEFMKNISSFSYKVNTKFKYDALINILRKYIILNEDRNSRDNLLELYVLNFYENGHMCQNKDKVLFLSIFYQMFYAAIYCEVEVFNKKYRMELKDTFKRKVKSDMYITYASASKILKNNIKSILKCISNRFDDANIEFNLEFYPLDKSIKKLVWTRKFNIYYYFLLLVIYNSQIKSEFILECLNSDQHRSDEEKLYIINQWLSLFYENKKILSKGFQEKCKDYARMLDMEYFINEDYQETLFNTINCEGVKLKNKLPKSETTIKISTNNIDMKHKIVKLMKQENIYGYTESYISEIYNTHYSESIFTKREYTDEVYIIRDIEKSILNELDRCIYKNVKKVEISFDLKGISKLKKVLRKDKGEFNAHNFIYTEDLALVKFKNNPKFKELKKIEKSLEFILELPSTKNIVVKKEKFQFNFDIVQIKIDRMSRTDCINYLSDLDTINGLYEMDGLLMTKQDALQNIENNYKKLLYEFNLYYLNPEDAVVIDFKC